MNNLSLPTSNVDVERLFPKVNLCKNKVRNKINTETLTSLIITSEMVKEDGCFKFTPTSELLKYLQNKVDELFRNLFLFGAYEEINYTL